MDERTKAKRIVSQTATLRKRVASKSKSLDLFDRPPQGKTSLGLPRHRSMVAMPMMASIPEDSSYRDRVGEEEPVAYRSPVSLDNGYRPTTGSRHHQTSTLEEHCGNTCRSDEPRLRECDSPGGGETFHLQPRLKRQCSLQSPLYEGVDGEAALRLERDEGLPSVVVGGRGEGQRRKETRKKRERVLSLPPVWQLLPVACLYLLLLLLLHLISPIIPSLPASPPTCGLYNQSITRHSSL